GRVLPQRVWALLKCAAVVHRRESFLHLAKQTTTRQFRQQPKSHQPHKRESIILPAAVEAAAAAEAGWTFGECAAAHHKLRIKAKLRITTADSINTIALFPHNTLH